MIMESTYGDRSHDKRIDYISQLTPIIQRTLDRGGNVVIPSFAVGRTQELLYLIRQIKDQGLIHGHDHFPVYVDSPLAVEATQIFSQSMYDYFDSDALALIDQGINPINFSDLKVAITSDDSITINEDPEPKVIISASGMCEAGRIRHHLKHNLWRPESTILFVGYQANGTLGRAIVEGAREVGFLMNISILRQKSVSSPASADTRTMKALWPGSKAFIQIPPWSLSTTAKTRCARLLQTVSSMSLALMPQLHTTAPAMI